MKKRIGNRVLMWCWVAVWFGVITTNPVLEAREVEKIMPWWEQVGTIIAISLPLLLGWCAAKEDSKDRGD